MDICKRIIGDKDGINMVPFGSEYMTIEERTALMKCVNEFMSWFSEKIGRNLSHSLFLGPFKNNDLREMKVFGLSGARRSGKSTFGKALSEETGFPIFHSFGPMKSLLKDVFMNIGADEKTSHEWINGDHKDSPQKLLNGMSPRDVMETLSAKTFIWLGASGFINSLILKASETHDGVIIDSITSGSEEFKERGGFLIKIIGDTECDKHGATFTAEHTRKIVPDMILRRSDGELSYRVSLAIEGAQRFHKDMGSDMLIKHESEAEFLKM